MYGTGGYNTVYTPVPYTKPRFRCQEPVSSR